MEPLPTSCHLSATSLAAGQACLTSPKAKRYSSNPNAVRFRRHYLRQKALRRCVIVEIGPLAVDRLLQTQWLPEAQADDDKALGRSISALLDDPR
jgi:hypothetical protein